MDTYGDYEGKYYQMVTNTHIGREEENAGDEERVLDLAGVN